jgi:hypothetical protein
MRMAYRIVDFSQDGPHRTPTPNVYQMGPAGYPDTDFDERRAAN